MKNCLISGRSLLLYQFTRRVTNNYHGIALLSTSYKILSNILLSRLSPYIDEIIGDHQCDVHCIGLAQNRDRWRALVNSVLNLRVPQNAGKLSGVLTTLGLSGGTQLHKVSYGLNFTLQRV
jgi:hypothetical protein